MQSRFCIVDDCFNPDAITLSIVLNAGEMNFIKLDKKIGCMDTTMRDIWTHPRSLKKMVCNTYCEGH